MGISWPAGHIYLSYKFLTKHPKEIMISFHKKSWRFTL